MIEIPLKVNQVLKYLLKYILLEVESPSGDAHNDWHKGKVETASKDELLYGLHLIISPIQ